MTSVKHFGKRVDGPLGRRRSKRVEKPIDVSLFTLTGSCVAILSNLSCTGAKLKGPFDVERGDQVWLRIGTSDIFGKVTWANLGRCGVCFDERLSQVDVERLTETSA